MVKQTRKKMADTVSMETTIHLHKHMVRRTFKYRAPTAVKKIRAHAERIMKTKDVRLDVRLNKFIWSRGVKGVPGRVRVRLDRKINEDENAKDKTYTLVTLIPVESFSGLETKLVDQVEE
eukprot:NODE_9277_length_521_cov_452.464467_g9254_i0.p2 GENE.NODE_9277_length_521_cov_452.464467_g9254_i0~~NODE_9277_length_521_cov_452.464467_g9254_i0.p2  ORF type:complete len:120 (+),score=27.43 NODE_9277_length_521_cov_452.464467_g9254_i0:71-430(+)